MKPFARVAVIVGVTALLSPASGGAVAGPSDAAAVSLIP
jgi:hypothetical protein